MGILIHDDVCKNKPALIRPMLLFCTAGIAVSYMTWTMASTFSMFVLARFIGGLAKGNVSLSTSAVADVSDAKTR